jgi:hypothetical protein
MVSRDLLVVLDTNLKGYPFSLRREIASTAPGTGVLPTYNTPSRSISNASGSILITHGEKILHDYLAVPLHS